LSQPVNPSSKTAVHVNVRLLTIAAFFAFFVFGFSDNLKGPVLPALLDDLQFDYAIGGTILMGLYAGFMAATLLTGLLADRFGQKMVLVLAGVSLTVGVVGFTGLQTPVALTSFMVVLGFGMGAIELGCNALIVNLHITNQGRILNLMSVMHGLGSMSAPLYAGMMLANEQTWRTVYRGDLLLSVPLILLFALLRFPQVPVATNKQRPKLSQLRQLAFTPPLMLSYAAVLLYVCTEMGLASWLVEFLQKERGLDVQRSTQALSLFWGLVMFGRFIGSFVVDRIGYLRAMLMTALAASTCIAVGLFGPPQAWPFLPATGFFLSIIFPTITASTARQLQANKSTILGLLFTFAGLGGIIGPWLVGIVSDFSGLMVGFSLPLFFGLALVVIILAQMRVSTAVH
jgi:MFS transporter, FHS family, glucose/mannose:H+ symporter